MDDRTDGLTDAKMKNYVFLELTLWFAESLENGESMRKLPWGTRGDASQFHRGLLFDFPFPFLLKYINLLIGCAPLIIA